MKEPRLDGASKHGARNRYGTIGAVIVGLTAAALIVGPHLIGGSSETSSGNDRTNETHARSTRTLPVDPYANPCPATPVAVSAPSHSDAMLPTDPVMVRLCRARVGPVTSAWQAPPQGLVSKVGVFLDDVAKLPQAPASPCPRVRLSPAPFALQITDSTGSTRTVSSPLTHCGAVTVNGHRVAADAVLELFREALKRQEKTLGFSSSDAPTPR